MMVTLSINLFCPLLANGLNDLPLIERLLAEHSDETDVCIPIALGIMLETDVPSTSLLLKYLTLLWRQDLSADDKTIDAAEERLTPLVEYFLDNGVDVRHNNDILIDAANRGFTDVVKVLLNHSIWSPKRRPK